MKKIRLKCKKMSIINEGLLVISDTSNVCKNICIQEQANTYSNVTEEEHGCFSIRKAFL